MELGLLKKGLGQDLSEKIFELRIRGGEASNVKISRKCTEVLICSLLPSPGRVRNNSGPVLKSSTEFRLL